MDMREKPDECCVMSWLEVCFQTCQKSQVSPNGANPVLQLGALILGDLVKGGRVNVESDKLEVRAVLEG